MNNAEMRSSQIGFVSGFALAAVIIIGFVGCGQVYESYKAKELEAFKDKCYSVRLSRTFNAVAEENPQLKWPLLSIDKELEAKCDKRFPGPID